MLNPWNIRHIENPGEEAKLTAVRNAPDSIFYIGNPSEEIQMEAVSRDFLVISYILNPTEKVQWKAINMGLTNLAYINNPAKEVQIHLARENKYNSDTILYCSGEALEQIKKEKLIRDIIL